MRVLTVYPTPTIEQRFVDVLLDVVGHRGGEVWIVSPWITDFDIPLKDRGFLLPYLGSELGSIRLSALVELVARHNSVHLVCRPPHRLVSSGDLSRLCQLIETRRELRDRLEKDAGVQRALALLEHESEAIAAQAASHADTVRFAARVRGTPGASVHFNDRLHAKILVAPGLAIVGSANFTYSGMHSNDEASIFISEVDAVDALRGVARQTASRKFSADATSYDFRTALRADDRMALDRLLGGLLSPGGLLDLLQECETFRGR